MGYAKMVHPFGFPLVIARKPWIYSDYFPRRKSRKTHIRNEFSEYACFLFIIIIVIFCPLPSPNGVSVSVPEHAIAVRLIIQCLSRFIYRFGSAYRKVSKDRPLVRTSTSGV